MQNLMIDRKKRESAGDILRFWRKKNKISQLDLSLDVGVSSKHLSFVETGKSRPSRALVLKMAHSLRLPLRHRNAVLKAAGYAAEYGEEPFDGQKMKIVRQALRRMLENHEPYPAFVVNSGYQILMTNTGFDQLVKFYLGENGLNKHDNAYRLTFAEDGLWQYIKDWPVVAHFMLGRLWEEMVSAQSDGLFELYDEMSKLSSNEAPIDLQVDHNLPFMSFTVVKDSMEASFFTTITSLGTPLDLTTQELRIESLFPADEETKQMFPLSV